MQATLKQRHGDNFAEKSLIVCSGLDMVNINCTNIIFKDVQTATVSFRLNKQYELLSNNVLGLERWFETPYQ